MGDSPNIVFIVFDTMRKDILGTYGGAAVTPNFDALAKDSVVYQSCVVPSPWTTPSHASFFTGLYPSQHGIHETREMKSPQLFGEMNRSSLEPVASSLRAKGYNTIAYSANPSVSPGSGFDLGFNSFTLVDATRGTPEEVAAVKEASKYGRNRGEVISNLARQGKFLELVKLYQFSRRISQGERARGYPIKKGGERVAETLGDTSLEQPFLLFLNLFEMHEPYSREEPSAIGWMLRGDPLGPAIAAKMKDAYRREAEVSDAVLGSVVNHLKQNGVYEDSLIVVTADHGQCISEHGYFGHGTYLYDELIEAPLLVKLPGNAKVAPRKGYQSLTNIPALLKTAAEGESLGEDLLTSESAFSEAFGIAQDVSFLEAKGDKRLTEARKRFEVPRKAVYRDGYKLVFNFRGEIEEFSLGKKPIEPKDQRARVESMIADLKGLGDGDFRFPSL